MSGDVVLALRALGIGDLLVSVPALRGLRAAFPADRLVVACPGGLAPLLSAAGCVDAVLPVGHDDFGRSGAEWADRLGGRVRCAVNLHGRGPQSHAWLDGFGAEARWGHRAPGWPGPVWEEDIHERQRWVEMLAHFGVAADPEDLRIDPTRLPVALQPPGAAVIHVGAAQASRLWPVERFAAVGRVLLARGHDLVLTGDRRERVRAEAVAADLGSGATRIVAGEQSLPEFCATIAAAEVTVSADTGAAHLASAFGVPSVVVYGPVPPARWGPPAGPHIVLDHPEARRGDPFATTPDPALLAATVGEVVYAFDRLGM